MLERIAKGRTDLVFDWIAAGIAATAQHDGASLLVWCAYYGDVSAMRHLLVHGERLETLGENFDMNGAAITGTGDCASS